MKRTESHRKDFFTLKSRLILTHLLRYLRSWCIILLSLFVSTTVSCAQAPGNQSDVDWLIEVLDIDSTSVIADVGAGDGDQTLGIARYIGKKGKVYSTELGSESIAELRREVSQSDLGNITVLEGAPERTNLTEQCCDAIFMRRVYHHISDPKKFNISLRQTLKYGGRLAVIDFEPRSSEADPENRDSGSQHGVTAETVIRELEQVGFRLISADNPSGRNIYIVMEKPMDNNAATQN